MCVGAQYGKTCCFCHIFESGVAIFIKRSPNFKVFMLVLGGPCPSDNSKENKSSMPETNGKREAHNEKGPLPATHPKILGNEFGLHVDFPER